MSNNKYILPVSVGLNIIFVLFIVAFIIWPKNIPFLPDYAIMNISRERVCTVFSLQDFENKEAQVSYSDFCN